MAAPAAVSGAGGTVVWGPCQQPEAAQFHAECGTLRVPVDWSVASVPSFAARPAIDLALLRIPATGPSTGTVVGDSEDVTGLGGSQISWFLQHGRHYLAKLPRTHATKDIVVFDPRGLGGSAALTCSVPGHDAQISSFPATAGDLDRLRAHNAAVISGCQGVPGLAAHMGLRDQVLDVEALRSALGEARLDWLGQVTGSELGTAYAATFPARTGRIVLDAVVDPYRSAAARAVDAAAAEETAFDHFAAWCAAASVADCVLHGQDVGAVLDQVVARADAGGVSDGGSPPTLLTGAEIRIAVGQYMFGYPIAWPGLAQAIAAAEAGDGSGFDYFLAVTYGDPDYSASRVQTCADAPAPTQLSELRRLAERVGRTAPHTGGVSLAWEAMAGCVGVPTAQAPLPLPGWVNPTSKILVTATTGDPIVPYRWAADVAGRLAGSRLLTAAVDGHGALDNSTCAAAVIDGYLADGALPAVGTVCRS